MRTDRDGTDAPDAGATAGALDDAPKPIDMLLYCPSCGYQHVDAPLNEWTNPPHKSHLCHECKTIWRPADVPTNGVMQIATKGSADTWFPFGRARPAVEVARRAAREAGVAPTDSSLRAENERLREALEYYGSPQAYDNQGCSPLPIPVIADGGHRARTALNGGTT